jgi:hypothetical protein
MSNETIRIFFPLKIVSYPHYGSEDDRDELTSEEAVNYEDLIRAAIKKINESNLKEYLNDGILKEKVESLYPSVEVLDDKLWGVVTAELTTDLTLEEKVELISQIEVQNINGWGACLKKHLIKTQDCELCVSFCKSDNYTIMSEQNFSGPTMGNLS